LLSVERPVRTEKPARTFARGFAAAESGYDRGLADVAQLVEHQLPKLRVVGSNPIVRLRKAPQITSLVAELAALPVLATVDGEQLVR
jgi:hypothetical protein